MAMTGTDSPHQENKSCVKIIDSKRPSAKTEFKPLSAEYDEDLAGLIRSLLKKHHLDIPGTAYYDESLDHLSEYYQKRPGSRAYDVLLKEGRLIGGIGIAEFPDFDHCCELQKIYLAEGAQGQGIGYRMIDHIEERARELGYKKMYLETHDNLQAAIHIYEKAGFRSIPRPESVVHSTMNRFFIKDL